MNTPSGSQLYSRQSLIRTSRTKTRTATPTSPRSRSQTLHIIEELSEEDHDSKVQQHHYSPPPSPTRIAKSRRRQGLPQGAQVNLPPSPSVNQLSFDEQMLFVSTPPRAAPRPPSEAFSEDFPSPDPFRLTFDTMGISFSFPHPPLPTPNTPNSSFPVRHGAASPTPSLTSSPFSSPCSFANMPLTPSTSDDESFYAQPKVLPRRATIKPLFIVKSTADTLLNEIYPESELESPVKPSTMPKTPIITIDELFEDDQASVYSQESDSEEATEWYAREMESVFSLYSPAPLPTPLLPARPESFQLLPAPKGITESRSQNRLSKPLPPAPAGPSQQLDPDFSKLAKLSRRASLRRTSRPPPPPIPKRSPPPTPISPDRPPPRMSLPADVDWDILADGEDEAGYQYSPDEFTFSLDEDEDFSAALKVPFPVPASLNQKNLKDIERRERELQEALASPPPPAPLQDEDRVLRSRWSSSTLSSVRTIEPRSSPSSKLRFFLGGVGSPKKQRASSSKYPPVPPSPVPTIPATPMSPFTFSPAPFFNAQSSPRKSHGLSLANDTPVMHITHETVRALRRKGSRSSTHSRASSSGGSDCSAESAGGLKRKPIPVSLLMRG